MLAIGLHTAFDAAIGRGLVILLGIGHGDGEEEARFLAEKIATLRIFKSLKPVIGAINGAAVGIGMTMQLPMDIRMASTTARFGFVFARRGITPEAASIARSSTPARAPSSSAAITR
jgi:enoyl-CoA hydratase/carnithine racemase